MKKKPALPPKPPSLAAVKLAAERDRAERFDHLWELIARAFHTPRSALRAFRRRTIH